MSFAHPIFTSAVAGGTRLATQAGRFIFREVGRAAVDNAANTVLGLVAETAEQAANFTIEQFEQLSANAIAALYGVHCPGVNDDRVIRDDATVNRSLNVLAEMDGGAAALGEAFNQMQQEFQFDAELAMQVANVSVPQGCAIGILRADNDLTARRKFPEGSSAPTRIRNCVRTSTDGRFVSREVHEWEYCRVNQWGAVLEEARQWSQRVLEASQNGDQLPNGFEATGRLTLDALQAFESGDLVSFATQDYTFGNFVDGVGIRRGIEQLRRVNRAVTGDRFTELFRLLDTDADMLRSDINNSADWSEVVDSMIRLNVSPGSGPQAAATNEDIVEEVELVNDN